MSTERRYAIPVEQVEWPIPGAFDTVFRWEYEDARDALVRLYEKAKNLQWNTNTRIDWSQDLDPENPQQLPDESVSIYGSDVWNRLTAREKANVRRHSRPGEEPARRRGERVRDAGRGAARRLRAARAARLLSAAHAGRARRTRGVRGRGVLPHARPLPLGGGLGDARAAGRGVRRLCRELGDDAPVPLDALQPHRADDQGHRPLGAEDPPRLCQHGHHGLCGSRHRGAEPPGRARRPGVRRAAHVQLTRVTARHTRASGGTVVPREPANDAGQPMAASLLLSPPRRLKRRRDLGTKRTGSDGASGGDALRAGCLADG